MLWWFDTKTYVVPSLTRSRPSTCTRTPVVFRISHDHARAGVRRVAATVEHARSDRDRSKDDRVDADGGNEKKNRPPPVVGRQFKSVAAARQARARRRQPAPAPAPPALEHPAR